MAKTGRLRDLVVAAGGAQEDLEHLARISERAMPINNPKVSLAYCRSRGTTLPMPHAAALAAFVRARPLPV